MKPILTLAILASVAFAGLSRPYAAFTFADQTTHFQEDLPAITVDRADRTMYDRVVVCYRMRYRPTFAAEHTGQGSATVTMYAYPLPPRLTLGPDHVAWIGVLPDDIARVFAFGPFDGTLDFGGSSGATWGPPANVASGAVVIDDPALVARILDGEQLTVTQTTTTAVSGPGNFTDHFTASFGINGEVFALPVGSPAP